eukprot:INCI9748.1.p1 GENE.INCI9748.1~~INCI9748.1.p1  ORF type:complete len:209 (+),score=31.28 INCI9748.1:423-1049(+)
MRRRQQRYKGKRRCSCHVTGQDFSKPTPVLFLQIFGRLLLSVNFVLNVVDIFTEWDDVVQELVATGIPDPAPLLGALVALLLLGVPLLLLGIFMRWTAIILLIFQISSMFLLDPGNWAPSVSVMGGVIMVVAVDEVQRSTRLQALRRSNSRNQPLLDPLSDEAFGDGQVVTEGNVGDRHSDAPILHSVHDDDLGRLRALSDREGEIIV